MWNIERSRAVITGAASGIGQQLALQLARKKVHLSLIDIRSEPLEETAEICRKSGVFVQTIEQDLCDPDAPGKILAAVKQDLGGAEILINNAGIAYYGRTEDMSAEQREQLLAVNFMAPVRLTHTFIPLLLENRRSHVLNMASMYGLFPTQRSTMYHASKYGLLGFSTALRVEYARYGLGATAMAPGFVRTEMFDSMMLPDGREQKTPPRWISTTPEKVARKSIRAIQKNRRLVPITLSAYAGYYLQRFLPGLVDLGYHLERRKLHPITLEAAARPPAPVTTEELLAKPSDLSR